MATKEGVNSHSFACRTKVEHWQVYYSTISLFIVFTNTDFFYKSYIMENNKKGEKKMNKNLYQTIYEDGEIEFSLQTPLEKESEEKRLKNLGVKFTIKIVNHLKKNIN